MRVSKIIFFYSFVRCDCTFCVYSIGVVDVVAAATDTELLNSLALKIIAAI